MTTVIERLGLRRKHYRVSSASRMSVFARDDFTCRWCHAKGETSAPFRVWRRRLGGLVPILTDDALSVDHIIPRSLGGPDRQDNLQTLCLRCNDMKGTYPWPDPPQGIRWYAPAH